MGTTAHPSMSTSIRALVVSALCVVAQASYLSFLSDGPDSELEVAAVEHARLLEEFCTVQGGKNCPKVVGGSSAGAGYSNVAGVTDCANCSASWGQNPTNANYNSGIRVDSETTHSGRFSSVYTPDKCCNLTNDNEKVANNPSQAGFSGIAADSGKCTKKKVTKSTGSGSEATEIETYEYEGDCPKVGQLVAYACAAPNEVCCYAGGKTFKAFVSEGYKCCAVSDYHHYECPETFECGQINTDKQQIKCIPTQVAGASATAVVSLATVAMSIAASTMLV